MYPNLYTGKAVFLCRVMYWCYVVLVSYVVYTNKPVLSKSKYLSIKYLSSMEDTHWEWGANPSVMKIFPDDCAVINHMWSRRSELRCHTIHPSKSKKSKTELKNIKSKDDKKHQGCKRSELCKDFWCQFLWDKSLNKLMQTI